MKLKENSALVTQFSISLVEFCWNKMASQSCGKISTDNSALYLKLISDLISLAVKFWIWYAELENTGNSIMFDIHAYKVLFNFVDNSDLCESLAEVDRKK